MKKKSYLLVIIMICSLLSSCDYAASYLDERNATSPGINAQYDFVFQEDATRLNYFKGAFEDYEWFETEGDSNNHWIQNGYSQNEWRLLWECEEYNYIGVETSHFAYDDMATFEDFSRFTSSYIHSYDEAISAKNDYEDQLDAIQREFVDEDIFVYEDNDSSFRFFLVNSESRYCGVFRYENTILAVVTLNDRTVSQEEIDEVNEILNYFELPLPCDYVGQSNDESR